MAFATEPIRDSVTFGSVGEGRLDVSPPYLSIAPISNILDTLTLLTVAQHIAIILTAILVFVAFRVVPVRKGRATTMRREVTASLFFLGGLLLTYALAALAPRPMAQFITSDGLVLAVDFHSHTKNSHDGRAGWTEDDVRAWHRAAGYDVAYITDHGSYEGAERESPPIRRKPAKV